MRSMKETLEKEIKSILESFGVKDPKVSFDYPARMDFGDLSTNVAMAYAKELGKNPHDLAEEIKEHLVTALPSMKVEVVSGFINFFFDTNYFSQIVSKALSDKYGKNENLKGQKTIVEYTDPNPFKEFHIGHLMPNVIGESISRIIEANGAEVKRVNYQGDVGLHVAKAVWAIQKGVDSKSAYVEGHKAYEEDKEAKKEIIEINKKIYDKSDEKINKIYENSRKQSLDYFENIYKQLGTKFDFYFFESEVGGFGKKVVERNIPNVFEKSDPEPEQARYGAGGAVIFRGGKYDPKLHTRVFINKEGLPTYEAKELGLAKMKYDKYPYDKSIIVTANEINEYFKVLLKAMSFVFPELAQKTTHISHGMLKLPEGKMSSRTGNIILADTLINQVKTKILEKINDDEIAEVIAIGAIKYFILRQAIGGDIIFDFDKSVSFEGDSGPYLQYATVRANSLLKKASMSRRHLDICHLAVKPPSDWQTTDLERLLERFPSVVERAGSEYAPHHIVTFLIELAGEFNSFYASHKIIDQTDPTSPYRLALTQAFVFVMSAGLDLLGIKVPEKM